MEQDTNITSYTAAVLKDNNKKNILKCIYSLKRTTQPIVAQNLNLSRPTVTQILKELTEEGHIEKEGYAQSTGGRKANMYAFCGSSKIAIGVELLIDRYEMIALDLYADMIKYEKKVLAFSNTEEYYEQVSDAVNKFIDSLYISKESVLGVGIALQALISSDGQSIIYGKILNCTGLNISQFSKRIPYKCIFNHDAESLANTELWVDRTIKDAVFFNIRDNLSGAVIIGGDFFRGGELKSGVFEHMTIVPDGRPCYCGKKGCVNSYCSISAFLNPGEDVDSFFQKVRTQKAEYITRWEKYLENLAMTIDNLHMFITSNVILGGTLSKYLVSEDVDKLQTMVHKRSAFPSNERYIKISRCAAFPLCHGAAIPLLNEYIKKIMS